MELGFKDMPVRFFVFMPENEEDLDSDIVEVSEEAFLAFEDYPITYERHTVWQNGVSQICLTKMPQG